MQPITQGSRDKKKGGEKKALKKLQLSLNNSGRKGDEHHHPNPSRHGEGNYGLSQRLYGNREVIPFAPETKADTSLSIVERKGKKKTMSKVFSVINEGEDHRG